MRIAIPQWQGRIAPVFDVAGHLLLVDVENGREIHREERRLVKTEFSARAAELLIYGTDVLICGAISAPLQLKIVASGVRVSAFVCGAVEEVLAAYLNGTLGSRAFAMPGCQRWRWRGGEDALPTGFGMGRGRCRLEPGQGRTRGAGKSDGRAAAGTGAFSICSKCGERLRHKEDEQPPPSLCPRCGTPMTLF